MSSTTTALPQTRSGRALSLSTSSSSSSSSSSSPPPPPPPTSPSHHPRRPSISNTMHWLSRSPTPASSSAHPYSPSKPLKVSEPKRVRTIDSISPPRTGTLGAGATVVRTPDEALRETGVRLSPQLSDKSRASSRVSLDQKKKRPTTPALSSPVARRSDSVSSTLMNEPISPPTSPPLPPIPLVLDLDDETVLSEAEAYGSGSKTPPRPNRAPPPAPLAPSISAHSRRSSMKGRTISTADDAPTVPPLPPHIVASTQPPPFHALLVSEPPSLIMDPSKIIVTLETSTQSHKTTLSTIYSRSSHLSAFFSNLFHHSDKHSTASVYSMAESDDLAMYNRHLTSQGLLPPSINVHVFLDRPSTPYSHILSYLRSLVVEGQAEVLPRALQLNAPTSAQARLENLIEVRDEAAFLNLDGLHKLCSDEIRLRYGPRLHTRGNSASSGTSIHSLHASICSLHTLLERVETDLDASNMASDPSAPSMSANRKPPSSPLESTFPLKSPPTPQSWDGPRLEQRSHSRSSQNSQSQTPPAGWI